MTTHYLVKGKFGGRVMDRAYYVNDTATARRSAASDGADVIYNIKEVSQNWLTRQQIGRDYGMLLLRAIAFQVNAGIVATKAVQTAIESEKDDRIRVRMQPAIDVIIRGGSLADSLKATGLFDETVYSILVAGEQMGGVVSIRSAIDYLEDRKSGMRTFMVGLSVAFMELSTAVTLPPTIHEMAIPWIRKNLPKGSPEKMAEYTAQLDRVEFNNMVWMWISFGAMAAVGVLAMAWLTEPSAKRWITHKILVKIPLVGDWYANEAFFRSFKTFAKMMTAGVKMNGAVDTIIKSSTNEIARRFWLSAKQSINTGMQPGAAFSATGLLRRDEMLVLNCARSKSEIAIAFAAMSEERFWRQKALGVRIFRWSIMLMLAYIGITMLIGLNLFQLFNAGLEISMNSMTNGF